MLCFQKTVTMVTLENWPRRRLKQLVQGPCSVENPRKGRRVKDDSVFSVCLQFSSIVGWPRRCWSETVEPIRYLRSWNQVTNKTCQNKSFLWKMIRAKCKDLLLVEFRACEQHYVYCWILCTWPLSFGSICTSWSRPLCMSSLVMKYSYCCFTREPGERMCRGNLWPRGSQRGVRAERQNSMTPLRSDFSHFVWPEDKMSSQ